MDLPELPLTYAEDGSRYLAAVEALGLRPAAFFWAYDRAIDQFVLVLITTEFDAVGPLAIAEVLFKASNTSVTPSTIDPFIVRLHSPNHQIVKEMEKVMPFGPAPGARVYKEVQGFDGLGAPIGVARRAVINVGDLAIDGAWVYRFDKPLTGTKMVDVLRRWRRFARNVDARAA